MKALIVVDYTFDFVADEGKLTCGAPGQSIESRLTSITKQFIENNDLVVFAVDLHEEDDTYHPEMSLFPPHNIKGTKGREQYGMLGDYINSLPDEQKKLLYWMDKTRYSAFAGTNLDLKLRERSITEIHLVGVCSDICVLHTAIDAYNRGFSIVVHEDAVQSFNAAGHDWALQHFTSVLGAKVVNKSSH
ncbi:cysteine hydrolase family protein [Fictibacillus fluitans]|uniref:Isochorismatase family cysteine hydrolase n=1 Tax=Fictibacillus fluitans TaxID=3058422 RepID=A0ABT8HR36_9BACL|nr:isochorismatase family cysteine hydrolase [Fictibacillus sp. NE201]MDN4523221.1 isochorismatase family cysteine hydrolase [Fictibacillus sp. NE201]